MAYKALYRTYRPQTFAEVAGQAHIVKTLQNALETGKIAHAYLFAGPRGTGKTSMAKLFAKALNCEEGVGQQCEHCRNCIAIAEGNHPDVIEIDAASNNGVEQVRDLIDKVRYSTILGRYKVYIIDEVHMMTPGAFNALLKTLEEPPENVVFILATTEPNKILPTILSRCQRYDFSKLSDEEIRGKLKYVLEKEGITYDEDAVNLIITLADGGMRDALSILDQVLAYSGDRLVANDILSIFSLESVPEKMALLASVFSGDVGDVLNRVRNYIQKGTDIRRLTNDLLMILKDLLVYKNTNSGTLLETIREEDAREACPNVSSKKLIAAIDCLMEAVRDYRSVSSIGPLFEVTLLKMSNIDNGEPEPTRLVQPPYVKAPRPEGGNAPVPTFGTISPKPEPAPIIAPKPEPAPVAAPKPEPVAPKEEPQPSLFDFGSIDPSKIDSELVLPFDVSEKEGHYFLDDALITKIMIVAKKDIKNKLMKDWEMLKALSAHPTYGAKASLLMDGHPLVATKQCLIVEYDFVKQVEKLNAVESQKELQALTQVAFKKKMFVYAISRAESVELQRKFINLRQIGKLPKPETIDLKWIGE